MNVVLLNENKSRLWYIIHIFLLNRIPSTKKEEMSDNIQLHYQFMIIGPVTKLHIKQQLCWSQTTDLTT